jgi:NADP-dependent 3-hydroxy acid dehydrogenase YdfG
MTHFLVTGAASGIGKHLVGALSRRGESVLAADLDLAGLERAAASDRWSEKVKLQQLDVRSATEWEVALGKALEHFGTLEVLLNVAGVLKPGNCWQVEVKDIDLQLDVNAKGVIHGTRVVGRYFVANKKGHVVNLGSLASLAPAPGLCLYAASKFAVRGFSLAAAQELEPHGVALSLIMPDAVQTPMLDLQVDYPEAALTFSGAKALTVEDIERVLFEHVLPDRPLEVALPWTRGFISKVALVAPGLMRKVAPLLSAKGRKAQERAKRARGQ